MPPLATVCVCVCFFLSIAVYDQIAGQCFSAKSLPARPCRPLLAATSEGPSETWEKITVVVLFPDPRNCLVTLAAFCLPL